MIEESHLTKCFEMMIERLTALECKTDAVQTHLSQMENGRIGCVDTKVWGLDVDLFVHKPLYPPRYVFERPDAFLLKTDWYDVEWGNRLCMQGAIDGRYDDDLAGLCDIETLKKLLSEEKETGIVARCAQVGLKSSRVFVVEDLGDIEVRRWLKRQDKQIFKSIRCDWSMEMGVSFWLTPITDKARSSLARKTSVQDCVEAVVKLLKDFGGPTEGLEVQLCPLSRWERDICMVFELAWQRENWKVEDDVTVELRKAVQSMTKKTGKDMLRRLEMHDLLRDFFAPEVLSTVVDES